MNEFWSEESSLSDFELPGDAEVLARLLENSEAEQVAENTDEVPAATEDTSGRLRGPDGKFVAKPDVVEEPAEPEPAEPEPEPLILGKFKSPEDLAAAYQNLESHLGELRADNGELRKVAERLEQLEGRMAQPAPQQITEELIERDPASATLLAYEQGNQQALNVAYEAWAEEAPAAAGAWAASKHSEQQINALNAQWEERYSKLEQRFQPLQQASAQTAREQHVRQLAAEIPDIASFVERADVAALAQEFPLVGNGLYSEDPADQAGALKALYHIHRGRASENLKDATQEVARVTAEEAQKAREDAFVASASATAGSVKPSPAELIAAEWSAREKPYEDGWNV